MHALTDFKKRRMFSSCLYFLYVCYDFYDSYTDSNVLNILFQFQPQFTNLWNKNDLWGFVAREVLQEPCRIQNYVKDIASYQNVVTEELPPRLSLRRLGSQAFVVWFTIGYLLFKLLSYSGFFYLFVVVSMWIVYVLMKASLKILKL